MIYTNFLLFITALALIALAPEGGAQPLSIDYLLSGNILAALVFWQVVRYRFIRLKMVLARGDLSIGEAKRQYNTLVNIFMIGGLMIFSLNILAFDLKFLLQSVPWIGNNDTFINGMGLGIFVSYLVIVWYYAYDTMGDVLALGRSRKDYIKGNLKFNLAIVIPWLCYLVIHDIMRTVAAPLYRQLEGSAVSQFIFFGTFLLILAVLAPVMITRLWDCHPLNDPEIVHMTETFSKSQKVKFKSIMSWNALNGSLVTAGVMGLVYPFRYLLFAPELLKLLDKNEIMGVVCHEVGHVKKKHLFFYLVIFIGMTVYWRLSAPWLEALVYTVLPEADITQGAMNFAGILGSLVILVVYFRFVFGYFMRNFERQADIFCFECGVDPDWLISSFQTLGAHIGDDGRKPNWHHYNIPQRIDYIQQCKDNPKAIGRHHGKVRKGLGLFLATTIMAGGLSFIVPTDIIPGLEEKMNRVSQANFLANPELLEPRIIEAIKEDPDKPELYALLGEVSYQLKKWKQARAAYEQSLKLNYSQAPILNNLAWLYLTCPDNKLRDHKRALKLAQDAEQLETTPENLDTLAEAYFQNAMYKQAFDASKRALELANDNLVHFKAQFKKMKKHYLESKDIIKI